MHVLTLFSDFVLTHVLIGNICLSNLLNLFIFSIIFYFKKTLYYLLSHSKPKISLHPCNLIGSKSDMFRDIFKCKPDTWKVALHIASTFSAVGNVISPIDYEQLNYVQATLSTCNTVQRNFKVKSACNHKRSLQSQSNHVH